MINLDFRTCEAAEEPHVKVVQVYNEGAEDQDEDTIAVFYVIDSNVSEAENRALRFIRAECAAGLAVNLYEPTK